MFKILVTERIYEKGLEILLADSLFHTDVRLKIPREELLDCISNYDAILVRSETKVTADLIQMGKRLKVIGRAGNGLDNIDVHAASAAGIRVLNTADESIISVAEHTMGMILALARHIPQAHKSIKERRWEREKYVGIEIYNKILGIIGMGRIGYEVALRAKAMGMQVVASDPYCPEERAEQIGVTLVPLNKLLSYSDFISLHVSKNPSTESLLSFAQFDICKNGVRIINTSRGGIVDEKALIKALKEGKAAGAALDVFENEPYIDEELLELSQVIITPHIGASTVDAQVKIAVALANNIIKILKEEGHHFFQSPDNQPVLFPRARSDS